MRLDWQFVRILAVAIVMIAAYFVPSAGQAHAGHAHLPPTAVTASDVLSARSSHMAAAAIIAEVRATPIAADVADPDTPAPIKRCNGDCCCSAGMHCCAHGILALEAGGAVLMRTAAKLAPVPDFLARPGIDPEALPKPPRTFA